MLFDKAKLLLEAGYCPSQITTLVLMSVQSLYFFMQFQWMAPSEGHQNCDQQICRAYQNNLGKYTTRHACHNRGCGHFSIDVFGLEKILRGNQIPLLRITPGRTLAEFDVHIISSELHPRYVALSHVWADGLGNPDANALPRCQLSELYSLVKDLSSRTQPGSVQEELLIWCDTLCCPVTPEDSKSLALKFMRRVYEHATKVLVLDKSLRLYSVAGLSTEEICARIATSGWMRRLWTLQEVRLCEFADFLLLRPVVMIRLLADSPDSRDVFRTISDMLNF